MAHIVILEPDRTLAKCIQDACEQRHMTAHIAINADDAIEHADLHKPDAVITELSLAGHSGSEFIYEFRTYPDWLDIPLYVFSSMRISEPIQTSRDWKLLGITEFVYKPDVSLHELVERVQARIAS